MAASDCILPSSDGDVAGVLVSPNNSVGVSDTGLHVHEETYVFRHWA